MLLHFEAEAKGSRGRDQNFGLEASMASSRGINICALYKEIVE